MSESLCFKILALYVQSGREIRKKNNESRGNWKEIMRKNGRKGKIERKKERIYRI